MEYVSSLTFLGEMYVDLEQPKLAIDAFERSIDIYDKITAESSLSASEAVRMSVMHETLEKVGIMKILAE